MFRDSGGGNYGPGLVRTKTVVATIGARVFFQSIGRLFTRSPAEAGAEIAELATGGYESGFYGPKLKRSEAVGAQTHARLGPALLEQTEQLPRSLTPHA